MKKLLLPIIILLALSGQGWGATCTAQAPGDGNWWTAATWSCGGETRVPVAGDDVALAGYVIVWDVANGARIPATSGSLGTVTSTGTTGQISVDLSSATCNGDKACTFHASTITGGAKPTTSGTILVTGSADATDILGIYADIQGGASPSNAAVNNTSTGKVYIEGTITGGSSTSAYGFNNNTTGSFEIVGAVSAGSGVNSYGVNNVSTSTTGKVTGNVTGSSASGGAGGINIAHGNGEVEVVGNLINGSKAHAVTGKPPIWQAGNTYYMYIDTGSGAIGAPDTYFYNNTDPGIANVKSGTTYYYNSGTQKTGIYSAGGSGGAWGF